MFARHITGVAAPFETIACFRTQRKRYSGVAESEAKPIPVELDLRGDINLVFAPAAMRRLPSAPSSFAALMKDRRESVSKSVSSDLVFVSMRFQES
jgi:hypothetical protein